MNSKNITNFIIPKNVFLLGYGAVGKCFVELILKNFKNINLKVCDINKLENPDTRFEFIHKKISKENILSLNEYIKPGDVMIDLSCDINVLETWEICMKKGVNYLNTSMENWQKNNDLTSYPKNLKEMYVTSEGCKHDSVEKHKLWNKTKGPSSVFEFGMNPGIISHLVKKGIIDAAKYFLNSNGFEDLNKTKIEKYLNKKNFSKLSQERNYILFIPQKKIHSIYSIILLTQNINYIILGLVEDL